MPVNAPPEYMKAEEKFKSSKTKEEKIAALEEMIRLMPRHHGSEAAHAQLKSRLAKLKKETVAKSGSRTAGITKEGDAQVCIIGFTKAGKSTMLASLTGAKPAISPHPYTTTKLEVGMMDYRGAKIQLIEIPSTFNPKYMSVARTSDLIVLASLRGQEKDIEAVLEDNYIRVKHISVNPFADTEIKEKIWSALGKIIVYTKSAKNGKVILSPMAMAKKSTVKDFAERIHKDFIKDFRFARVFRKKNGKNITIQVGINYVLEDGDAVELHTK